MNVEIGAEAALFPEKEHISGISVAVHWHIPVLERYVQPKHHQHSLYVLYLVPRALAR